jgi:hypothetical protein
MWRVTEKHHTPIMTGLRALAEERGWEVAVVPLVTGQRKDHRETRAYTSRRA